MNSYNKKPGRGFGKPSSGGRSFNNNRSGGSRYTNDRSNNSRFGSDRPSNNRFGGSGFVEKFEATCDSCHKSCQIPFKPTSNKPVYCDSCFRDNKSDDFAGSRPERKSFRSDNRREDRGYNNDFRGARQDNKSDEILAEISKLNDKIDKLFSELEPRVINKLKVVDKSTKKKKLDFEKAKTIK
jgi:CxxC-x17-CxxC domain-containing protein